MNRLFAFSLAIILCLSLFACTTNQNNDILGTPLEQDDFSGYPYKDENGYYHYKFSFNGRSLGLTHDALLLPTTTDFSNKLLPLSAFLDYFHVEYLWDQETDEFSATVNGTKFTFDGTDIRINGEIIEHPLIRVQPSGIDGAFYVPAQVFSFLFTDGSTFVYPGIKENSPYINFVTKAPFSINGKVYNNGSKVCNTCFGLGRLGCTACSKSGHTLSIEVVPDPVTGTLTPQQVFAPCTTCGGLTSVTCYQCGGDGRFN